MSTRTWSANRISTICIGVVLALPGLALMIWGSVGTDLTLLIPLGAVLLAVGAYITYAGAFTDVDAPLGGQPVGEPAAGDAAVRELRTIRVGVQLLLLIIGLGLLAGLWIWH